MTSTFPASAASALRFLAAVTTCFVLQVAAHAAATLRLDSSPGDYIGGGALLEYSDATAAFTASCSEEFLQVSVTNSNNWWYLDFASPRSEPLAIGVYEEATRHPFQSPTHPGLSVTGNGAGCNRSFGRFVVRELSCSGGVVQTLAIDAEQHCESPTAPVLRSYLRINSAVPQIVPQPTASAGRGQTVTEGDTVMLDGSRSYAPGGIASVNWQQISGPLASLSDATSLRPDFVAPAVAPGGATLEFQITVTGNDALVDANRVKVRVRDQTDPRSFLTLASSPGDYIGSGITQRLTSDDGIFTASCGTNTVAVALDAGDYWRLNFANVAGQPVVPEVYEDATRYPFNSPLKPGLDVSGAGRGCNQLFGRFVVREMICLPGNVVEKLAIDAEQHCENPNSPPLRAYLRINSSVPEIVPQPTASAGPDQSVTEGDLVTLDGSHSFAPDGIVSAVWQVVSGPAINLSDSTAMRPSFVAPDVAPGGTTVVLELRVTGSGGQVDANRVTIFIRDNSDPRSSLVLVSHPGDYIGGGMTRTASDLDNLFSTTCSTSQLHVGIDGDAWWDVHLAAADGGPLTTGTYEGATRWPFQNSAVPGLDVSGDGRGCNMLSGRFVISEIACATDGKLQKLAVDAEQHCEGAAAPLFAFLRVNSSVPIPEQVDRGCRLDVDGDGSLNKVYDGSTLLRGLAGLVGYGLQGNQVPPPGATRSNYWQLEPYFRNTCALLPKSVGPSGCSFDLDGDGRIQLTTDGVIATRLIAGLSGEAVLTNALGTGATRTNWTQLAGYLAACKLLPGP